MDENAGDNEDTELIEYSRTSHRRKFCQFTKEELVFTICMTLLAIGSDFAIDIPASLQDSMVKYYKLTEYQFSLFYTFYSLPSIFLNTLGGFLIDNVMGLRTSTVLYTVIATLGIYVSAAGCISDLFWLMLLGRLLFGLGNEMVTSVCLSYYTFNYFKKSSVNFLFSMGDNVAYLGTVAVFQLSPKLFEMLNKKDTGPRALNIVILLASCTYLLTGMVAICTIYIRPKERDVGTSSETMVSGDDECEVEDERTVSITDIFRFPLIFWLLCIVYCCFLNASSNFETFSQGMLTSQLFGLSVEEASNAVTVMNVVKIAVSIPLSLLVDRIGRNIMFVTASMTLCTISYILLITKSNPYFIMVLMGLGYSLTGSSIWTMFAYPVDKHLSGSSYGIVSAANGICQTLSPSLVGNLIDNYGYSAATYFYLANAGVALSCIILTWVLDRRSVGILGMTPEQRMAHDNN